MSIINYNITSKRWFHKYAIIWYLILYLLIAVLSLYLTRVFLNNNFFDIAFIQNFLIKIHRQVLESFFNIMNQFIDKTILIHCAYNWRVSCFVYLYRVLENNITEERAKNDMLKIWKPDKTWQSFIDGHLPKQDLKPCLQVVNIIHCHQAM